MRLGFVAAADSVHSRRWIEYFSQRGHEVHWFSLAAFRDAAPAGVKIHEVDPYFTSQYDGGALDTTRTLLRPSGLVAMFRGARRTRRILRENGVELLHVHSVGAYGLLAALTGFHPLIATPWGSDVLVAGKSALKRPVIKYIVNRADRLTCDAYHMKDALGQLGVPGDLVDVIFFGTDTKRFRPDLNARPIRERLGVGDRPMILSTRNFYPIYDIGTLIRAMVEVGKLVPEARCFLIGRGSEREALEALARELGVTDRVTFIGAVKPDEMPLFLAAADIYVSTSLSDAGLAASTAEAMASGLPCVVTDTAENSRWVEEGKGGFLIPVTEPGVLAEKLVRLARNPEERKRFGAFNRPVIDTRNNHDLEMEKIERLYETMAERLPAARR